MFLKQRRASKVSFIGERMYLLGGTGMGASCGVWWIDGTALVNRNGFFLSAKER